MRKFMCFIDTDQINPQLGAFLETLDGKGEEVYLFTNVSRMNNDPSSILYELDKIQFPKAEGDTYIFITNMKDLFEVVYRMLHQVFYHFIYFSQEDSADFNVQGIYRDIFLSDISEQELIYKPIYANQSSLQLYGAEYKALDYQKLLEVDTSVCQGDEQPDCNALFRKYYCYHGIYYLFEPVLAERKVVIHIGEKKEGGHETFRFPGFDRMQYRYEHNEKRLNEIFTALDELTATSSVKVLNRLASLEEEMTGYFPFIFSNTCCILEDAAQLFDENDIYHSLMLYSFLMQVANTSYHYCEFLKLALNSKQLTCDNRFFLWHQCKRFSFTNKIKGNQETSRLYRQLYHKAFQEYAAILEGELTPIKKEERNEDLIVVFAIQFLSEGHAPTRTTLERCYTIGKLLGKRVLLINTREQYTSQGEIPVYQASLGNVIPEYSRLSSYQYKDLTIPFYQPEEGMPSIPVIRNMIEQIKIIKPSLIFSIGDGSIVADLCGKLVPEASISVVFSGLATTAATFSVIGRKIAEAEWEELLQRGYTKEGIIESTFTFELKEKKRRITRESLNLPIDRFLLVAVGIRLDSEIEDDFIEMLAKTYSWGTHIVFAGKFERYDSFCDKHPALREHSTYIGYNDDILSLMEVCDLYINPRRRGGGFSIIEAFHEGKPGVTLNFGDVSVAAGEDFCVKDYEEMTRLIKRYIEDKDFYQRMSEKARAREVIVTSSAIAMEEIIRKIKDSPLYF